MLRPSGFMDDVLFSCHGASGSESRMTVWVEEAARWRYQLDVTQLQCLVEFIRMWYWSKVFHLRLPCMFAVCSAATSLETEPAAAASPLEETILYDVDTVTSSVPTVADSSDEVVESSDVEQSSSPSYPEHVQQA